jgi:hypothetical protein
MLINIKAQVLKANASRNGVSLEKLIKPKICMQHEKLAELCLLGRRMKMAGLENVLTDDKYIQKSS